MWHSDWVGAAVPFIDSELNLPQVGVNEIRAMPRRQHCSRAGTCLLE